MKRIIFLLIIFSPLVSNSQKFEKINSAIAPNGLGFSKVKIVCNIEPDLLENNIPINHRYKTNSTYNPIQTRMRNIITNLRHGSEALLNMI